MARQPVSARFSRAGRRRWWETIVTISAKQSLRRRIKLTEATIRDDEGAGFASSGSTSRSSPGSSAKAIGSLSRAP